ncbi:flavocytochrome c [Anaerococcus sp. AGMB00486]|uniref:Urocanate reductase n=1 Tax=Anaerococcus faecalis TaxID=2742993 RepID=A0ABX2NA54_9FIRM|nr:flavocytochrome c [Anaerococcus faecalis]NVF11582.1 flavocytochrome c [Anaerococcus faecalis]
MKIKNIGKSLLLALSLSLLASSCSNDTAVKEKEGSATTSTSEGVFEASEKGYGGDVTAKVKITDGVIESVDFNADKETDTIGQKAIESLSKEIVDRQSTQIETVSGATISSTAFLKAVNEALKKGGINPEDLKAKEAKKEKIDLNQKADIVVIGAGGAGLTSAISAAQEGKSVIVVEKAANAGGNTNRATGGMNASETKFQKEAGINDSNEDFFEDTMKGGHNINNPDLVRVLVDNSSDSINWLDELGARLSDVGVAGGAKNPRQHRPVDENGKILSVGPYIVEKLLKKCEELNVPVIYNARVEKIKQEDGKIAGVTASTDQGELNVDSKAVIVASGGFGGSNDMVKKYRPDLDGYVSTNAPTIEGDAIKFLEKLNAGFVDMDQIQTHPTVVQKDGSLISESLRGDGAILLNKEGTRFTDEMGTRDAVSSAINEQTDKTAWLVVDQKMYDESNVIKGYADRNLLTKVEDVKALADFIGTDEKNVKESLEKWSNSVDNKEDGEFNRKNLDKIKSNLKEGPYYVGPIGPGIHHTMGGVMIDTKAQVLDKDNQVIEGLYAAGEVTGGVHGGNRLGGNAVSDIITFGRIAGKEAAGFVGK